MQLFMYRGPSVINFILSQTLQVRILLITSVKLIRLLLFITVNYAKFIVMVFIVNVDFNLYIINIIIDSSIIINKLAFIVFIEFKTNSLVHFVTELLDIKFSILLVLQSGLESDHLFCSKVSLQKSLQLMMRNSLLQVL